MPGSYAYLRQMSDWLSQSARSMGVSDDAIFRLDLCANEAITNTIGYGFSHGGNHTIELCLHREGDFVTLCIEDDGEPFDPLGRPVHAAPPTLAEAPVGGLGVDLIRDFMSECHYERRDKLNVLSLRLHLS